MTNSIILDFITAHFGSLATVVFILICGIVEKSNLNFNPFSQLLGWLGNRLMKNTYDKLDTMNQKVCKIEQDFFDHKIESQRRDILNFADDLMRGERKTKENFDNIIHVHDKYATYIEENNLENGQIDLAYDFITRRYRYCRDNNCFL